MGKEWNPAKVEKHDNATLIIGDNSYPVETVILVSKAIVTIGDKYEEKQIDDGGMS